MSRARSSSTAHRPLGGPDFSGVLAGQDPLPLGGVEQVDLSGHERGVGGQLLQDPAETGGDHGHGVAVEDVVLVLEGEPEMGVGVGRHDQRVVAAGERRDAGDGHARLGVGRGQPHPVDGVGLEDDGGVEQGGQSGRLLDVHQSVVVMVE
ncbi:hypothetical protein ABIE67_008292 [Streptomyces sp. V4I8]